MRNNKTLNIIQFLCIVNKRMIGDNLPNFERETHISLTNVTATYFRNKVFKQPKSMNTNLFLNASVGCKNRQPKKEDKRKNGNK